MKIKLITTALALGVALIGSAAHAQQKKPNIVVIWGDDIGVHNISAYTDGLPDAEHRPPRLQEGTNLNPSNINYMTLKAAGGLKALETLKTQGLPTR